MEGEIKMKKLFTRLILCFSVFIWVLIPNAYANTNEESTITKITFNDLSSNYRFYEEIYYLVDKDIISGFKDNRFRPDHAVTREQAAIMIGRALHLDGTQRSTKFKDVREDSVASGYIASALEKEIITGFPDDTYRPSQPVTRGQMAIFLDRAFQLKEGKVNSFKDVKPGIAAYQAILNVTSEAIASGYPNGTYRPDLEVTRGQFSAFMARTLEPSFRNIIAYAVPKKENAPVYDNHTAAKMPMVYMKKNQPMIIDKDVDANWWQVKVGNGYGYVNKADVNHSVTWTTNNVNPGLTNSNKTIITKVDTNVLDSPSGSVMGTIKAGYRYPVIGESSSNLWKIDFGGRIGYIAKNKTTVDNGVPILMYHHILTAKEKAHSAFANANTTITTAAFNEQMQYLKDQGYTTISLLDLEKYMNNSMNLPAKSIVITFDDGLISTREYAYPVLKKHGFTAEQFIITGRIQSSSPAFNWTGLQFFSQQDMNNMTDVFNYGSHTHALHNLNKGISDVVSKPDSMVYSDFQKSKQILDTNHFAYPFGHYDQATINTLKSLGFTMAVTTKHGKVNLGEDKLQLQRINVVPGMTLAQFAKNINN